MMSGAVAMRGFLESGSPIRRGREGDRRAVDSRGLITLLIYARNDYSPEWY